MPQVTEEDDASRYGIIDEDENEDFEDQVPIANLAGMDFDMNQLDEDDIAPITKKEVNEEMNSLLGNKFKIKSNLFKKHPRIMKIEQETVIGVRCLCPGSWRPFEAYAISSNHTFELARLERNFKCHFFNFNRPEMNIYST